MRFIFKTIGVTIFCTTLFVVNSDFVSAQRQQHAASLNLRQSQRASTGAVSNNELVAIPNIQEGAVASTPPPSTQRPSTQPRSTPLGSTRLNSTSTQTATVALPRDVLQNATLQNATLQNATLQNAAQSSEAQPPSSEDGGKSQWNLALKGPAEKQKQSSSEKQFDLAKMAEGPLFTTVGSLCVVLSLFFLVMWLFKKSNPKLAHGLPSEAVEVLGTTPLNGKQKMQLVRLGNKILLLAIGPDDVQTLGELTDPEEVLHVAALCQKSKAGSSSETFRQVLRQMGREPASEGFLDSGSNDEPQEERSEQVGSVRKERRPSLFEA